MTDGALMQQLQSLFPSCGPWAKFVLAYPNVSSGPPATPLSTEITELGRHRLAAKMLTIIRDLGLTPSAADLRRVQQLAFAASALTLSALTGGQRAVDILEEHGIRVLVIKGPGIADAYLQPKWRPFGDLDLLVHPRDFTSALKALEGAGWRRGDVAPLHREYFLRYCQEGVNLDRGGADRIDLHHAISPWAWGQRLSFDRLWDSSFVLTRPYGSVRVPAVEQNFAIACLHLLSDHSDPGATLMIWQDLLALLSASDAAKLRRELHAVGLDGLGSTLLRTAVSALPSSLAAPAWLGVARIPRSRRLSALLTHSGRNPMLEWLARLPSRCVPLFLAGLTLPSPTYLRQHHIASVPAWWRSRWDSRHS